METYGGTHIFEIDPDIEDATIVAGTGTKTYSYAFTPISFPGALVTEPIGLNNNSQLVGEYYFSVEGPFYGFMFDSYTGTYTQIVYPGATVTEPFGINDQGQVVGIWTGVVDGVEGTYSFLYQNGTFTSFPIDPLSCGYSVNIFCSVPWGINDDAQVSGYFEDNNLLTHGFFYNGNFATVDLPGMQNTHVYGINGDSYLVGAANGTAFVYNNNLNNPVFTTFADPNGQSVGQGLNNNGQVAGYYGDNTTGAAVGFLYSTGTFTTIVPPGTTTDAWVFGINDAAQIVGLYGDSPDTGYVGTPQTQ